MMDPTAAPRTPSALALDLYQLTMAQAYLEERMGALATFSLFVRELPQGRGYLVAAGLDDVLCYLEAFSFTGPELEFLRTTGQFSDRLLDRLANLRFSGSVRALPEGTVFGPDEPVLEVTAPILEAQLVETAIINAIQLQTMIATKAARCVLAGRGRSLIDFGLRRTQGIETGLKVARASYLAGFVSTSNVQAGRLYGIPIAGTMAHSFIEAFPTELDAFRAYARAFPDAAVLLLDTYDTIVGAQHAAIVGRELAEQGHRLRGVRLDSGDLIALSRSVRAILDAADLRETLIFASGNLDEYAVERAVSAGAPIDGFGVGTRLGVSADAPFLEIAYKLVAYGGHATAKLSPGKVSLPGPKQVWRTTHTRDGREVLHGDWLGLRDEDGPPGAVPLLVDVMADGRRLRPPESLAEIRERVAAELARLPEALRRLDATEVLPVHRTAALTGLQQETALRLRALEREEQMDSIVLDEHDALVVVDPQNDFCPGGSLAVAHGDEVFAPINAIMGKFAHVFATKDWHPPEHRYFQAFGGPWPYHCLAGSRGAEFHPQLDASRIQETFYKGTDPNLDGYSAFAGTGLAERLNQLGIRRVFLAGLATDYCVKASAIEAVTHGFDAYVLTDAIRAVDVQPGDGDRALRAMADAGAHLISSTDLV